MAPRGCFIFTVPKATFLQVGPYFVFWNYTETDKYAVFALQISATCFTLFHWQQLYMYTIIFTIRLHTIFWLSSITYHFLMGMSFNEIWITEGAKTLDCDVPASLFKCQQTRQGLYSQNVVFSQHEKMYCSICSKICSDDCFQKALVI